MDYNLENDREGLLGNIKRSLLWNIIFNNLCLVEFKETHKDNYDKKSLATKIEEEISNVRKDMTSQIGKDWLNYPHKQAEIEFPEDEH